MCDSMAAPCSRILLLAVNTLRVQRDAKMSTELLVSVQEESIISFVKSCAYAGNQLQEIFCFIFEAWSHVIRECDRR